jgi:short-subunit dehydrogenase
MRAVVVGASAGVGRALTEALAARGHAMLLVASDERDLEAQSAHLHLAHGVHVETVAADAGRPLECIERIHRAAGAFGAIDAVFFPIGESSGNDDGSLSLEQARRLLDVNLFVVVGLIARLLPLLIAAEQANIVGFGSVAAIRGRGANVVYSAAKRGLESYFESLRCLTARSRVRTQFYRLGYVATQQSFGHRLLFPPATPRSIAEAVLDNLGSDRGIVHLPRYWSVIACVVRSMPWSIFKRLDF